MESAVNMGEWEVVESKTSHRKEQYRVRHIPRAPSLPDALHTVVIRASRHDFKPPLIFARVGRRNRFIEAVASALDLHNVSSFAHFCSPVNVSPLDIRPQYSSALGARLQYFAIGRPDLMARVPLFFDNDPRSQSELSVACGPTSMSLARWLERFLIPARPDVVGEAGYEKLYQYHQTKSAHEASKHSFATMPAELQETILLHMLGEVRPVRSPWSNSPMHGLDEGRSNRIHITASGHVVPYGPPKIEPMNFSIFRLNKKTRNMIAHIFKNRIIKGFDMVCSIQHVLRDGNDLDPSIMTRIQLALGDEEYLDLFGVNLVNTPPRPGPYDAIAFTRLPNLRYYEIWFRATVDADLSNPWYKKAFERGDPGGTYQFPCRKGMVDAIMAAAVPFIEHVKTINLTGYVKTQTRQEWLAFWADKHSTIQQRMLQAKKEALRGPPELKASSLRCKCRVSCFYRRVANMHPENVNDNLRGWSLVRALRWREQNCKEAIKDYRFDFDDTLPVPEYREQDCVPIPSEEA